MKTFQSFLLYLLAVAVVVLFYLHFFQPSESTPIVKKTESLTSLPVAFINVDTIYERYSFCIDLKKSFSTKQEKAEADMQTRFKALEKEVYDYQQKGATMTDEQREATEKKLMQKEQSLREYRAELYDKLEKEEADIRKKIHNEITTYLQGFSKKNQFKYVLAQGQGSTILYGDLGLDVTEAVLKGLNESYTPGK